MDFGLTSLNSDMGSNGDYDLEYSDPDACLNPVDRLEKYVESEHMYSRQLAARSLLETLQQVDDFSDAERVLKVLTTLANDADGVVRTELCEQLAHIGNVCSESRMIFTSGGISYDPLSSDILPIIYRYMTDTNNQVRKTSQTALAELVEQSLITNDYVVSKVSPIISRLADMDSSEDHRSEAASLLCRLAPIIGAELTEQLFLDLFLNFCTDHTFQIRKICAVNFGSICQVVGCEKTETLLLKKFFCLCTDAIWGVRKACTECFMQVSLVCSPSVRHSQLSAVFINLIADQSRWVRMSAFEALGGFIFTFANPDSTGLRLTDDGTIIVADHSVLPDEKRSEIVNDLKGESVTILDGMIGVASEFQPATAANSGNVSISSNSCQMNDDVGNKPVDISDCRNDAISSFVPQDTTTVYADNNVDASDQFTEVGRSEIAADNRIVCSGEHSDEMESKLIDLVHARQADECKALSAPQKVLENGVKESEGSGGVISENSPGEEEEVRWDLNGVVDQSVNGPEDKAEDALVDENLLPNGHVATPADSNCQLTNGLDCTAAVDMCALDICLESNASDAAADDMTQQFGSLNFWQKMVPELSETSHEESSNDAIMRQTENLFSSSDSETTTPAARNILNSKLLDSISHLCDSSVVPVNETIAANHVPLADVVENGDVGLRGQLDSDIQESNDMQNAEPLIEALEPNDESLNRSIESESNSIAPMECDDENRAEAIADPEKPSSTLETDEIPEFTGSGVRHKVSRPLLQLMDDSTDQKSTSVDVAEAVNLDNGIDVDEEEICELVAAAKDMSCDDVAIYEQDVVPSDLLEQYLSMMDPSCAQKVDSEITRHCAYSLPAVAYTLGRKNWSSLRNLYRTLATDVQWKVRRTLAFSIHELALIVGEEITSRDLVPVFDGFLNDLDEVRIGVLKHLADFLKLLPVETRCGYLLKIAELLKTDNSRNWRFREELARQLFLLLGLFTVADIQEHISPIALHLAEDRVAQVRLAAVRVLSHILKQLVKHVEGDEGHSVWTSYLDKLDEQFARSRTCSRRQMYVQICSCILQDGVISDELFAEKFLPTLLSLSRDRIPNVRVTLARTIAQHIKHSEFFSSSQNPHHEDVRQAIASLEEDQDHDVRFLINAKPNDIVEHSSDEIEA